MTELSSRHDEARTIEKKSSSENQAREFFRFGPRHKSTPTINLKKSTHHQALFRKSLTHSCRECAVYQCWVCKPNPSTITNEQNKTKTMQNQEKSNVTSCSSSRCLFVKVNEGNCEDTALHTIRHSIVF
mmetsp:Transcript_11893/g.25137  ORF Transcript_11893/g.25137 Transcript_11893/m.25137 type:complete len:129 (+) Transcript_11893:1498-1884(+)